MILTLETGAALVAAPSIGAMWWLTPHIIAGSPTARPLVWVLCIALPAALAYLLYWVPFWLVPSDQTSLWAPLVISVWSVAAIAATLVATVIRMRRLAKRTKHV